MLVEGAIFDIDGGRPGYVRLREGAVVETGSPGTAGPARSERRVRGIVVPAPVNGHTHLGDSVSVREPPPGPLEALVRPPEGYKFTLLARASPAVKRRAMRAALERMVHEGVAATIDFREEGIVGTELLREAAKGLPIRAFVLGRPLARPVVPEELDRLLEGADGVGLSSARDEPAEVREVVARACRARGKRFAIHASEADRELPETYLRPRPDLLVHLVAATAADLEAVRDERVSVAVCPRSNALFGRQPDLASMERLGLSVLLGTDNLMLHSPSIWRELEFAYVASRLRGHPVSSAFLARAALVEPWRWLGSEDAARVAPGSGARPIVLRLPPDDPAYQIVTRATEHLMVRGRTAGAGPAHPP